MRRLIVALALASLCLTGSAEAGVKSGLKKAAVKVGHVCENVVYVTAGVAAAVVLAKLGAFGG
jgi:hypothetical protein